MSSDVTPRSFDDVARSGTPEFIRDCADIIGLSVSLALIVGTAIHTYGWVQVLLGWV